MMRSNINQPRDDREQYRRLVRAWAKLPSAAAGAQPNKYASSTSIDFLMEALVALGLSATELLALSNDPSPHSIVLGADGPRLKKKIEELVTAAGMSKSTAANALVTVHARIRADKAAMASGATPAPAAISVSTGGRGQPILGAAVRATFPKHFPIECPKCKNGGVSPGVLSQLRCTACSTAVIAGEYPNLEAKIIEFQQQNAQAAAQERSSAAAAAGRELAALQVTDPVLEAAKCAAAHIASIRACVGRATVKVNVEGREPGAVIDVQVAGHKLRGSIPECISPGGTFQIQLPQEARQALVKQNIDAKTRALQNDIDAIAKAAMEQRKKDKVGMDAALREQHIAHKQQISQMAIRHKATIDQHQKSTATAVAAARKQILETMTAKHKVEMDAKAAEVSAAHKRGRDEAIAASLDSAESLVRALKQARQ